MLRYLLTCALCLCATCGWGLDRIRVVTTLPDLADWARQVGGERVEVESLLRGFESPHTYEPRVSDVKAIAGARVFVEVGLGLEEWTRGLVENARNSALIQVTAAKGVDVIQGGSEDHHQGNPHAWLDPDAAVVMCGNIAQALERADPFADGYYQKRLEAYADQLRQEAQRVRAEAATLPDRRFLSYHPAWPYFARGLGFEVAGVITEIPGQEPSAKALARLVERIRSERISVLVTEPQLSSKLPELLAQETGIRVVTLSPLVGTGSENSYLALLRENADKLIRTLRSAVP